MVTDSAGRQRANKGSKSSAKDASSGANAQGTSKVSCGHRGAANGAQSRCSFKPYHAIRVPKERPLEVEMNASNSGTLTTAMLRNIPNKYTQSLLLEEIDEAGFAETYDFFYLPMDVHNRANVGYAFVNFMRPLDLPRFVEAFAGYKFLRYPSVKIATVSPAHMQGFLPNVHHFAKCAVARSRNSQYRPLVRINGRQVALNDAIASELHRGTEVAPVETRGSGITPGLNPKAAEFVPNTVNAEITLNPAAKEFIPIDGDGQAEFLLPCTGGFALPRPAPPPGLSDPFENAWQGAIASPIDTEWPYVDSAELLLPPGCEVEDRQASPSTFVLATSALEQAVANWLQVESKLQDKSGAGSSTRSGSSSGSPRSPQSIVADRDLVDCC